MCGRTLTWKVFYQQWTTKPVKELSEPVQASPVEAYWSADRKKAQQRGVVSLEIWSGFNADQCCLPWDLTVPSIVHYVATTLLFKKQAKQKMHSCRVVVRMQIVAEYMLEVFVNPVNIWRCTCCCCCCWWQSGHLGMCCCSSWLNSTPSPSLPAFLFTYLIIHRIQGWLHALHTKITEQTGCKFSRSTIVALITQSKKTEISCKQFLIYFIPPNPFIFLPLFFFSPSSFFAAM